MIFKILFAAAFITAVSAQLLFSQHHGNMIKMPEHKAGAATKVSEDFKVFLKKFFSDEKFQLSRIVFPLPYSYFDPNVEGEIVKKKTPKAKWTFRMGLKSESPELQTQCTETVQESMEGNMVYRYTGPFETAETYIFKPLRNKWFLAERQSGY